MTPQRLQSGFDGWRTPLDLAQDVRGAFDGAIGLDPCTEVVNHLRAEVFYVAPGTLGVAQGTMDGLAHPWCDRAWVNPPYGQLRAWLAKVLHEAQQGYRIGLLLSVSRTEQEYMQSILRAATCTMFIRGKLKFSDGSRDGQLASLIHWFNVDPCVVDREMGWRGIITVPWR